MDVITQAPGHLDAEVIDSAVATAFQNNLLDLLKVQHEISMQDAARFFPAELAVSVCGGGEEVSLLGTAQLKEYKYVCASLLAHAFCTSLVNVPVILFATPA